MCAHGGWTRIIGEVSFEAMNAFEKTISAAHPAGQYADGIDVIQVNIGLVCNLSCSHCHLACAPKRTEVMEWETMEHVIEAARTVRPGLVDITGGAPELNPSFRRFVSALKEGELDVMVRTNLTVLLEPGMEEMPDFFRERKVHLVASLPCYLEENVDRQRGEGTYGASIEAIRILNSVGYGVEPGHDLDLVYNPIGPKLPPEQAGLEADYRRELKERFGIRFSKLLTITNMPMGRFKTDLRRQGRYEEYVRLLRESFNPSTVDGLMCRRQISVGWDGTLYDCDFNLALRIPVNSGLPTNIREFDAERLAKRQIVMRDHCFGCTAGCGSSCGGALA